MIPHFSNLLEAIESHAIEQSKKNAFTFDADPPCTYKALQQGIIQMASLLLQMGIQPRDRVLIAVPNSVEFFYAFYGVLKAGGIAVPVSQGSGGKRMLKFAQICDASFILTSQRYPNDISKLMPEDLKRQSSDYLISLLQVEMSSEIIPRSDFPVIQPDDVAFIQFTSGSTGDPRGVQISHAGLMINISQMIQGMQITKEDIFVSWLPVFHDMGLILMTMVPLFLGRHFFLLPIGFKYLKAWLKIIENHKVTFTAAPDFMYRLTMVYINDPQNYDLSSLRAALNAAEPVRTTTIEKFERTFNINNVLLPAYGLAEATVGVCCWHPGKPIKADQKGHVCVGKPFPGVKIKIDLENIPGGDQGNNHGSDKGIEQEIDYKIGEILVQSPATTRGYFKNPDANKLLFAPDNYIRTGDLGYLDENGDLTIVGRKKNIIIQGGMNISSREVEELVDPFSFVRRSAAAGIDRGKTEGEQVYIFVETKLLESQQPDAKIPDKELLEEKKIDIVQAFYNHFGFRPGRVILLPPRAIPMTQNGKTQYTKLVEQFLTGTLKK